MPVVECTLALTDLYFALSAAAPAPEPAPEAAPEPAKPKKPAPINAKTYHAHLGLARVYRALEDTKQAQKYYEAVSNMAPEVRHVLELLFSLSQAGMA